MTALRLEGRMFRAGSDGGEPDAGAGGGGICCAEVLLDRARTRGDSGTVFRSGMLLLGDDVRFCCVQIASGIVGLS